MRALSRLMSRTSGPPRRDSALDRSSPDFQAFALDRYAPHQQREIVKLIASQPVISRGDIADALDRAERRARRNGQLSGVATGVGFVAMFTLGILVAQHQRPPISSAVHEPTSEAPLASKQDDHWSPGGLDEADRQFFAEMQAGHPSPTAAPARSPLRAPPVAAPPVMVAAARPAAPPAQPKATRQDPVIQLGAFTDAAVARARWQAMSTRFPALRPLAQTVSPIARGGRTLYRLQASGGDAASACPVLTGAGATCVILASAAAPAAQPTMALAPAVASPPQPVIARHETVIQLGAFANAALAKARWQALSTKFPSLRPLTQTVSAVARGGRTLYRLRAAGTEAASACSTIAGAGATCFVTTDAS